MKKFRLRQEQLIAFAARTGGGLLRSRLLQIWLGLLAVGIWVGTQSRPDPGAVPFEEMFDNLRVRSYREAPSDSTARFVVELAARGRAFRVYDVDAKRFEPPARGHHYWHSISGTRYSPLKVRGHVNRGFWLELPDSSSRTLLPEQFNELYSTSLDFVKPVSIATTVIGLLSGYSVGYRLGTWGSSLSNSDVQRRVLATPGIGRQIAREAWRRVALEPVVVFEENDPGRIVTVSGRQRLYTNFFRLAANDSNGFIPFEAARLESIGCVRESRAMLAFANAVKRAARDTCNLGSADFSAVEEWASLIERRGHWLSEASLPSNGERLQYFGTLAWYGLAPEESDPRRIWIGPRLLVRNGDMEGFVADEVPMIEAARPVSWREWLGDNTTLSGNAWTAQWMGAARQFAPVVKLYLAARAVGQKQETKRGAAAVAERPRAAGASPAAEHRPSDSTASGLGEGIRTEPASMDSVLAHLLAAQPTDSAGRPDPRLPDSLATDSLKRAPARPPSKSEVIRATVGGFGR